jgi:hypothetical protein
LKGHVSFKPRISSGPTAPCPGFSTVVLSFPTSYPGPLQKVPLLSPAWSSPVWSFRLFLARNLTVSIIMLFSVCVHRYMYIHIPYCGQNGGPLKYVPVPTPKPCECELTWENRLWGCFHVVSLDFGYPEFNDWYPSKRKDRQI